MPFKYKILLITDSVAFPRAEPEFVAYEATYIAQLKIAFPECDFIHQGRGGATIGDLLSHTAYFHQSLRADLVFMQSGIVDCAPRALTLVEKRIIARLPLLRGLCLKLVKRHSAFLRRKRQLTYTSVDAFATGVRQFEALFPKVYWIGILPASEHYEAKAGGIQRNVAIFNAVLQQHRYVDTSGFGPSTIMSDHHHLNAAGHSKMFAAIAAVLRTELGLAAPPPLADTRAAGGGHRRPAGQGC